MSHTIDVGEFAPDFFAATATNPRYGFATIGGRYVALTFLGSAAHPAARRIAADFQAARFPFDDRRACAFLVTGDPQDVRQGRLADRLPGLRIFHDFGSDIARLYGMAGEAGITLGTFILDPLLRVIDRVPVTDPARHAAQVIATIAAQPPIPGLGVTGAPPPAPVLMVPNVFEPGFCRQLIDLFERHGGGTSGVTRERDGRTIVVEDSRFKRRSDHTLTDGMIVGATQTRITRRLVPAIEKAFQYSVTRMERHIVACYDSAVGGFFRPHRDNTTKGTAHRRFAVSLHLNSDQYEGGELRFPEFGQQTYRAPTGGAIVFSCSLLHEVTPVTAGKRYMFLPFLYDESAAEIRVRNSVFLGAAPTEDSDAAEEKATR